MNLSVRTALQEQMDDEGLDIAVYDRCLKDLAAVNRVTFTHGATLRWLDYVTKDLAPGTKISILDVAYGHGDLLRAIARWTRHRGLNAQLSGIDLNPRSALAACAATPPEYRIEYLTGDVFSYLPSKPVDFIVTSQFTHHLPDTDIVRLLRWFEMHARRGWHVTDLHRHVLPYYGFRLLARLMFWHRIVCSDGTISIARGFTRAEWQGLLAGAGISGAKISWHMLFRFGVGRLK